MGTVLAALAVLAAAALVALPAGNVLSFGMLAMMLSALGLGAWLEKRAGVMAAATTIAVLAMLIANPFALTPRQLSSLRRAAVQRDEDAAMLIDFYGRFEPLGSALLLLVVTAIVSLFVLAARRSARGAHGFLLDESDALARLATRAGITASFLSLPLIVIIVYDVGQRKYLDLDPGFTATAWHQLVTSTRLQELEWHLHATLFLMCLAFAYVRDAHVRIELVRDGLHPRARAWIELLGCTLFLLPYCYVVVSHGYDFARNSLAISERSAAQTGLSYRFVIKALLPASFLLLGLSGVSVALKCLVFLFGPPALGPVSASHVASHAAGLPALRAPVARVRK